MSMLLTVQEKEETKRKKHEAMRSLTCIIIEILFGLKLFSKDTEINCEALRHLEVHIRTIHFNVSMRFVWCLWGLMICMPCMWG